MFGLFDIFSDDARGDHMQDFFVSYNKADRSWAEWIAWELEDAGYSVLIQAWDFRPGSNFVLEMDKALKEAERMIAVLSPDYIKSSFTAPEWAAEFARDSTGRDRMLVPVRVREVDVPGLLGQIVYIDFVGVSDETATQKLLVNGVQQGRGKPTHKPIFPGAPKRLIKERPRYPAGRPSIWNIPHNRNRNFTGRDDLLSTLRSQLLEGHHSALTALHGLGGIGKTQTAVEYTYRYAGEYDLVWWIRSDEPATLASDFALLASRLGLAEAEGDQQAAVHAVKDRLNATPNWLLVFDNARNHEEIHPYLPAGGQVIITSRNPDWRTIADPLQVGTLRPEDAIAFLLKRSGQHDQRASTELVKELGWLPLAVEQAAAYIEVNNKPISDYLALFRKHRRQLLHRGQPGSYPDTVETTWELSFTELEEHAPAGAALLSLCAFLAPDDIPIEVITAAGERVREPLSSAAEDEIQFDEAVSALRRYSLVERRHDALSVHRLVQAVVRDRLGDGTRKSWAESAAGVIRKAFPYDSDDVSTWPTCARLLPHATIAAAHCEAEVTGSTFAAGLFSQAALYLLARADFSGAKALNERALGIYEAHYGPDHPTVATCLNNLGSLHRALGNLEAAQFNYQRALRIVEAYHGPDHPSAATVINNLGTVLKDLGEFEEAWEHLSRALKIDEETYGPDHPEVAVTVSNLGTVIEALGNLKDAQKHYERSLKIDEASYGPDHPTVAIRLNNLGVVLRKMGFPEAAMKYYERAVGIYEASYGPDHPDVAVGVNNLGNLLHALGRSAEAQKHFERALRINEAAYGPDHQKIAITLNNLGNVLQNLGLRDEARKHYERAFKILESRLGSTHPDVIIAEANLRRVLEIG